MLLLRKKHTQLVISLTTSLQASRTTTKVARSHVTAVLLEAFSCGKAVNKKWWMKGEEIKIKYENGGRRAENEI
jgi:hypothetical protein